MTRPLHGTVLHWNLAGWARHRGDPGIARRLARDVLAAVPAALAVTVNEVCDRQFAALAELLEPAGFSAAAAWSIPDFGDPACRSYGNAVFWRGGDGGVERHTHPDDLQLDGAGTREKRNVLLAASAAWSFRVATTHPAPRRDAAERQIRATVDWLDARANGPPIVFAGDLNLSPRSPALDGLYRTWREAERLPRWSARPTHCGFRKLDYVFVPRDRLRLDGYALRFRCRDSDHALVRVRVSSRSATPA